MKSFPLLSLMLVLSMLHAAFGLKCYDCPLCPTVEDTTATKSCQGTQTIAGVTMANKCASINIYEGPFIGVSRICAPNVIDGCMDIDYGGYKAKVCYCTTDRCNNHTFSTLSTTSPATTPIGQKLECYNCTDCPTTSSSTPTTTCEGTQTIAGIEMPLKCGTFHITEGPFVGYVRRCSANVMDGCVDMHYMGYKANVCYCTTDRCNGDQPGVTTTKQSPQLSTTGPVDKGESENNTAIASATSAIVLASTIAPYKTNSRTSPSEATGLTCYNCLLCPTVDLSTETQVCEGTQTIAGVTMLNKCASVNIYDGPSKGVSRICAPNIINGCMDIDYGGYKAKMCYCTTDRCNTDVFDSRPTATPPTTPEGQRLQCYECTNCPTTSFSTPTKSCEGTEIVAGVEMPRKCAIFHIYEGPSKGYARQCSPNIINGCLDLDYMGYKAQVCYCNTNRCNGGQQGLTSTELPNQASTTEMGEREVKSIYSDRNDTVLVTGTSVAFLTSTIMPLLSNTTKSGIDIKSNYSDGDDTAIASGTSAAILTSTMMPLSSNTTKSANSTQSPEDSEKVQVTGNSTTVLKRTNLPKKTSTTSPKAESDTSEGSDSGNDAAKMKESFTLGSIVSILLLNLLMK